DADACAAEPDGAGAADAADAADHGHGLAADDWRLRAQRPRRPGPVLVRWEPRQYHSAELRRRLGEPLRQGQATGRLGPLATGRKDRGQRSERSVGGAAGEGEEAAEEQGGEPAQGE